MGICEDIWRSVEYEGSTKNCKLLRSYIPVSSGCPSRNSSELDFGSNTVFPSICIIQQEVLFPSILVLLFSSIFCSFVNAIFNGIRASQFSYLQSIINLRRRLLQGSKQGQVQGYDSPRAMEYDVIITEGTHLLQKPSPPAFSLQGSNWPTRGSFFADDDPYSPSVESMGASLGSNIRTGPLLREALESSLHGVRVACQKCFFLLDPLYMTISIFKCLAVVIFIQYHFDSIPGGWQRFCICGTANVLSATCTPFLEFLNSYILPVDVFSEEEKDDILSGTKTRRKKQKEKMNNNSFFSGTALGLTRDQEEEQKDSVLIVEILVRIGQLQLTDLTTVLIQGTSFVIFLAIFLPMFMVFGIIGAILSCVPVLLGGVYYSIWKLYYGKRLPMGRNQMENIHLWRWCMLMEYAEAAGLKVLTFFFVQLAVVMSFMMGVAVLDGFSFGQAWQFVLSQLFRWHLFTTTETSSYQWITLCSQLFF